MPFVILSVCKDLFRGEETIKVIPHKLSWNTWREVYINQYQTKKVMPVSNCYNMLIGHLETRIDIKGNNLWEKKIYTLEYLDVHNNNRSSH